jgi:hypothetical protein
MLPIFQPVESGSAGGDLTCKTFPFDELDITTLAMVLMSRHRRTLMLSSITLTGALRSSSLTWEPDLGHSYRVPCVSMTYAEKNDTFGAHSAHNGLQFQPPNELLKMVENCQNVIGFGAESVHEKYPITSFSVASMRASASRRTISGSRLQTKVLICSAESAALKRISATMSTSYPF